jgi:hypothetical protein
MIRMLVKRQINRSDICCVKQPSEQARTAGCLRTQMEDNGADMVQTVPGQMKGTGTGVCGYVTRKKLSSSVIDNTLQRSSWKSVQRRIEMWVTNKLRGPQSASELNRPSDRHLLAKFSVNFCG